MDPIKFGFRRGAVEQTDPQGGYHCLLPGFMSVMVAPNLNYVSYGFYADTPKYYYTIPCDGILQAYCIILNLIQKHNRLEFLPEHLLSVVTDNKENEDE